MTIACYDILLYLDTENLFIQPITQKCNLVWPSLGSAYCISSCVKIRHYRHLPEVNWSVISLFIKRQDKSRPKFAPPSNISGICYTHRYLDLPALHVFSHTHLAPKPGAKTHTDKTCVRNLAAGFIFHEIPLLNAETAFKVAKTSHKTLSLMHNFQLSCDSYFSVRNSIHRYWCILWWWELRLSQHSLG